MADEDASEGLTLDPYHLPPILFDSKVVTGGGAGSGTALHAFFLWGANGGDPRGSNLNALALQDGLEWLYADSVLIQTDAANASVWDSVPNNGRYRGMARIYLLTRNVALSGTIGSGKTFPWFIKQVPFEAPLVNDSGPTIRQSCQIPIHKLINARLDTLQVEIQFGILMGANAQLGWLYTRKATGLKRQIASG